MVDKSPKPTIRPRVVADVLAAAHLSHLVVSPFAERGGIFFVSYPQMLKSTLIKTVNQFPDAKMLSDLNAQQMGDLKDALCTGRVRTVAFDEFNKLYQRNPQTAANLEGMIMAVVAQGWHGPAFKDQSAPRDIARCLVIGAITVATYERKIKDWKDTGFAERFLWCHFKLANPQTIGDAIQRQEPLDISGERWSQCFNPIPFLLDSHDRQEIRSWMEKQPGYTAIPYGLMLKIAVVLRWHYERNERTAGQHYHMQVLREFQPMIRGDDGFGILDPANQEPIVPHVVRALPKRKRGRK